MSMSEADRIAAEKRADLLPMLFVTVRPCWYWLPFVMHAKEGVSISWGPFFGGYLRRILTKNNPDAGEGE